jgi:hypothetical protein
MTELTAHILDGRFVVDAPEGSGLPPLRLVVEDEGGELEADDQARLVAFLDHSIAAADRGELVEASVFLESLRRRRSR